MKHIYRGWLILGVLFALGLGFIGSSVHAQNGTQTIELVGIIEAASGSTITVNQLSVDVSAAEVKTSLAVGTQVKVEGLLQTDGTVLAAQVSLPDRGILPGEIELVGTVDEIGTGFIVVNGLTFDTTALDMPSDLAVGDLVQVHARLTSGGTWAAREVQRSVVVGDNSATTGGEVELSGTLEVVSSDSIVVQGLTINTAQAEIKGTLVVGALVKVHAALTSDGTWVAREVELVSREANQCQFEVEARSANLRGGPGSGNDVVGTAAHGDKLDVLAVHTDGEWVQVSADDSVAWISLTVGQLDHCSSLPASNAPIVGDDNSSSDDGPGHDANDDHGSDSGNDQSGDSSGHDTNDDHGGSNSGNSGSSGDDGSSHDSGDDHGGSN